MAFSSNEILITNTAMLFPFTKYDFLGKVVLYDELNALF